MDFSLVKNYWVGVKWVYYYIVFVFVMYVLCEVYWLVLEEGLENWFVRYKCNYELLKKGLELLGFEFLVDEVYWLLMFNVVKVLVGVDEGVIRKWFLEEYNIEVGGGLGKFVGKIWCVGLMGESSMLNYVNVLLFVLRDFM